MIDARGGYIWQETAGSVRFGSVPAQAGSGSAGSVPTGNITGYFLVRMFWEIFRADVFFGLSGTDVLGDFPGLNASLKPCPSCRSRRADFTGQILTSNG